jgi:hypothetical protein
MKNFIMLNGITFKMHDSQWFCMLRTVIVAVHRADWIKMDGFGVVALNVFLS